MARAGLSTRRVAEGAAELADEVGFDQVTVSAVARRFGVRTASLYSHVASSHDLKTQVARIGLVELADRAATAMAGRSGREALVALGDTYRDYAREHPGRYAATRHPLDPADAEVANAGARHAELMHAVLRGYPLEETDRVHAVRLLGSVFHGFVTLELAGAFAHRRPDPQESWQRALAVLDTALRSWASTDPTTQETP